MKHLFNRFRKTPVDRQLPEETPSLTSIVPKELPQEDAGRSHPASPSPTEPPDGFIEWCRTQTHGGIEHIERNNIYEAYRVYGTDGEGGLICRSYHRYPEHERNFDLSNNRTLSFDAFNTRLLHELDKGFVRFDDYHSCIAKAAALNGTDDTPDSERYQGFSETEIAALHRFCEDTDTLTDKTYRTADGMYRCEGVSVVGAETLNLWFRKPMSYDALYHEVAGVGRTAVETYDIDDLWVMGVCNRLRDRCAACRITALRSAWSLNAETVYLITAEDFPGIEGTVLIAVAEASAFYRFGFYSLDFSNK